MDAEPCRPACPWPLYWRPYTYELRTRLSALGLGTTGNKLALMQRFWKATEGSTGKACRPACPWPLYWRPYTYELRTRLSALGLGTTGNKLALMQRFWKATEGSTGKETANLHTPKDSEETGTLRHASSVPPEVSGLTGLVNLGNICYMNSVIQCLNNTAMLVNYFCSDKYQEHINRSGPGTHGVIAEKFADVVRALWSSQYSSIAAKDLWIVVREYQRSFSGNEHHDSHEFLTILLERLHDDLKIPTKQDHKESLLPSEKAWQEYTKSSKSLILELFYGQIKSTVKCAACDKESVTYESFSNLSLELPANANRCSLSDCFNLYLNGETITGWNCPTCKEKRNATKKLDILRLPPILVIHFKRFYADPNVCNSYKKRKTFIDFHLQDFDMVNFALRSSKYNLYGVSNHYGSMESGHYTAYCKNAINGKWYKFDDQVVSEIAPSDVKSSAAYILFYTSFHE